MGSPSGKLKWGPGSLALPMPARLLPTPQCLLNAYYGCNIVGHVNPGLPLECSQKWGGAADLRTRDLDQGLSLGGCREGSCCRTPDLQNLHFRPKSASGWSPRFCLVSLRPPCGESCPSSAELAGAQVATTDPR